MKKIVKVHSALFIFPLIFILTEDMPFKMKFMVCFFLRIKFWAIVSGGLPCGEHDNAITIFINKMFLIAVLTEKYFKATLRQSPTLKRKAKKMFEIYQFCLYLIHLSQLLVGMSCFY